MDIIAITETSQQKDEAINRFTHLQILARVEQRFMLMTTLMFLNVMTLKLKLIYLKVFGLKSIIKIAKTY